jgi:hypothetical protein
LQIGRLDLGTLRFFRSTAPPAPNYRASYPNLHHSLSFVMTFMNNAG